MKKEIRDIIEQNPIIAAVTDAKFKKALSSPAGVIFCLKSDVLTISDRINEAHENGKLIFVHIDLADGIGKDRSGIELLRRFGVDGIISTRSQLIRMARDCGLSTVQRFFALDSQGLLSIKEVLENTDPDFMEIMPGVINKVTEKFAKSGVPVIAGGLVETKQEVTAALSSGAMAVSTGKKQLWYI